MVEKRVSLDDDIRKYLEESYPNLEYQGKPIRLVNIMNWTSELPNNIPDFSNLVGKVAPDSLPLRIVAMNEHYTKQDFLRDLHQVKLDTPPGSTPWHSNAANQKAMTSKACNSPTSPCSRARRER